jgi:hypothetical protein
VVQHHVDIVFANKIRKHADSQFDISMRQYSALSAGRNVHWCALYSAYYENVRSPDSFLSLARQRCLLLYVEAKLNQKSEFLHKIRRPLLDDAVDTLQDADGLL